MNILCGGPARETESKLYHLHRRCLKKQGGFVHHAVCSDPGGPKWDTDKIERVAKVRQDYMEWARSSYDGLLMVDTDLILGPGVLERMMEVEADVVYGVFWSRWTGFESPMPQVWDAYPFGHSVRLVDDIREGLKFTDSRWGFEMDSGSVREIPVLGGGACTLIRGAALDVPYHPLLNVLVEQSSDDIWDGEDRSFGVRLMASDIKQVAVTGLPIVHLDTPQKQDDMALKEAEEMVGW